MISGLLLPMTALQINSEANGGDVKRSHCSPGRKGAAAEAAVKQSENRSPRSAWQLDAGAENVAAGIPCSPGASRAVAEMTATQGAGRGMFGFLYCFCK